VRTRLERELAESLKKEAATEAKLAVAGAELLASRAEKERFEQGMKEQVEPPACVSEVQTTVGRHLQK
jgi:hypothetical protein